MNKRQYPDRAVYLLRSFFYNENAVIILSVVIIFVAGIYVIFFRDTDHNPNDNYKKELISSLPAEEDSLTDNNEATDNPPQINQKETEPLSIQPVASEKVIEESENEEELIKNFEDIALRETIAINVKVRRPGQVTFNIDRKDFEMMPEIMEQLAKLYINIVDSEKAVRVHFMVGGGARAAHTFLPKDFIE